MLDVFYSLFEEKELKKQVPPENEGFELRFEVIQYGAPIDESYRPDEAVRTEMRRLLLAALTTERGQLVTGILPTLPDRFHAGQLIAEVLVKIPQRRTVQQVSGEIQEVFQREIASRLKGMADLSYDEARAVLLDFESSAREAIARALSPHFVYHVTFMPQETYDEKRELAKWVNGELRRFGVAIRCPKTDLPAFLVADPGGRPGFGRFQLEVTLDGKPHRSVSSGTLMHLSLMAAPVKRDADSPDRGRSP